MSVGSQVNMAEAQLAQLLSEIRQETLALWTKGKKPNIANPSDAKYFEKVESWKNRLREIDLRLSRLTAGLEGQRAFGPPRVSTVEARRSAVYRATQSIDTRLSNVAKAQELARHVAKELEDLFLESIGSTKREIGHKALDLADDTTKFLARIGEALRSAGHSGTLDAATVSRLASTLNSGRAEFLVPANAGVPAADYLGVVTLMLTLLRVWWLERTKNERRG
jgi:hypothetical protein